jgi:mRNA interferase RelE/StbE
MKVDFGKSFENSVQKLGNQSVMQDVMDAILNVEKSSSLRKVIGLKKLKGSKESYRIRIGVFRIGLRQVDTNTVKFITVANRLEI